MGAVEDRNKEIIRRWIGPADDGSGPFLLTDAALELLAGGRGVAPPAETAEIPGLDDSQTVRGRDAIQHDARSAAGEIYDVPTMTVDIRNLLADGDWVTLQYQLNCRAHERQSLHAGVRVPVRAPRRPHRHHLGATTTRWRLAQLVLAGLRRTASSYRRAACQAGPVRASKLVISSSKRNEMPIWSRPSSSSAGRRRRGRTARRGRCSGARNTSVDDVDHDLGAGVSIDPRPMIQVPTTAYRSVAATGRPSGGRCCEDVGRPRRGHGRNP